MTDSRLRRLEFWSGAIFLGLIVSALIILGQKSKSIDNVTDHISAIRGHLDVIDRQNQTSIEERVWLKGELNNTRQSLKRLEDHR